MEHDMTDTERKNNERNSYTFVKHVFMFQSIVFCSSPILPRPFSGWMSIMNYY